MITLSHDVCNIGALYREDYSYSLPRGILEKFLQGTEFGYKGYTEEEKERVKEDLREIFSRVIAVNPMHQKVAVITAGAPGAGKTTLLHTDLEANKAKGLNFAYICPDDVALKSQTRTYLQDGDYNKWRCASNAITHIVLANLIDQGMAFYFGTTASSKETWRFFKFLKDRGYEIRLIHITAPDSVRWGSIQERDKTFIQTTEEDVREKGGLLPQRIMDTFLTYADRIDFYYRGGVDQDAQLAAKWERAAGDMGTLEVVDHFLYSQVKAVHNAAIIKLNRLELIWESTVRQKTILSREVSDEAVDSAGSSRES